MPAIRNINCENGLHLIDSENNEYQFTAFDIPNNIKTEQDLEDYLNNVWVPSLNLNLQLQVHIFALNPLSLTATASNIGVVLDDKWWEV